MDQTVKFTPLDMQTWPRGQMFYYFSKMAPTGYSLTVDLDVTAMRTALKHAGIKFFPAYLWLVTRTLQMQKEFKIAELDGQVGCFDTLTPLYAAFHEDDKTFSFIRPFPLCGRSTQMISWRFISPTWTTRGGTAAVTASWLKPGRHLPPMPIPFPVFPGCHLSIFRFTPMRISRTIFRPLRQADSMKKTAEL